MHCKEPGFVLNRRLIWPYTDKVASKDSNFWQMAYKEILSGATGPTKLYLRVKRGSVLADLNVDPCAQNPLDFMHQTYEGVLDKILDCLFGKANYLAWIILV